MAPHAASGHRISRRNGCPALIYLKFVDGSTSRARAGWPVTFATDLAFSYFVVR